MNKTKIFVTIVLSIFMLAVLGITLYYLTIHKPDNSTVNTPNYSESTNIPSTNDNIELPSKGNDTVITTKVDTSLRVINEYTTEYFTKNKNLLIMFGSWCSHCQEEMADVSEILKYYKDNTDVNIILIAHEYEDTISDLVTLVEEDVALGDIEILVDLKRIIRKTLDPEANSVPISYVVDKKGTVLEKHSSAITLEAAKDMLK